MYKWPLTVGETGDLPCPCVQALNIPCFIFTDNFNNESSFVPGKSRAFTSTTKGANSKTATPFIVNEVHGSHWGIDDT